MPKTTLTKKTAGRFNIRLDDETADFYRKKAQAHRVSLSEYLRQTLVQGVIAENVASIEKRLSQIATRSSIPNELLLSILTSEALLSAIVEAKDVSQLYAAQDRAKRRLAEINGEN